MSDEVLIPTNQVQGQHVRMARAGLNLSIRELAILAQVNKATVVRIEAGYAVRETSLFAVKDVLERKGAEFWKYKKYNKVLIGVDES